MSPAVLLASFADALHGIPGGGVAEERVEPYWWRADFPPRVGDQTQRGFDPRSELAGVQVRDSVVSPSDD